MPTAVLGLLLVAPATSRAAPAGAKPPERARPEAAGPASAKPSEPRGTEKEPTAGSTPAGDEPAWENPPVTRRGGFTVGIAFAAALSQAGGYPNDAKKIGRASSYTETGVAAGGIGTLWLGGALTDWFTFGVGVAAGSFLAGSQNVRETSLAFHIEGFPAWSLGGRFRELGAFFEGGTGLVQVHPEGDPDTLLADSGGASRLAGGAFYEGLRLWRISMGPYAGGEYTFSTSVRHGAFFFGWRTALYVKPKP